MGGSAAGASRFVGGSLIEAAIPAAAFQTLPERCMNGAGKIAKSWL
jgi:hypothetical protein